MAIFFESVVELVGLGGYSGCILESFFQWIFFFSFHYFNYLQFLKKP